ncbi:nuclear protein 1b [Chiloscyllium punctatum]|uniref:nuclear protein 1b n=1 Tax=Chiloscyllium punctatum TaxID=137246 RepID=UPI003B634C84
MADSSQTQRLKSSSFEEQYFDQYDYYNISDRCHTGPSRKGRSKKEASENTNHFNPAGHERKLTSKLQRSAEKRRK